MATINNYQDVMDSRDIIERIEELEDKYSELLEEYGSAASVLELCPEEDDRVEDGLEVEELDTLQALASDCSDYASDWQYGETLIRDSYFKEYAQDLAEDCGMVNESANWPNTCIDWEQAASELQMDYTCVSFDGVTYWIRAY